MKIVSYKELDIWKHGIEIVSLVFDATDSFPSEQKFILSSQMQKAAISIPSNIAEGFARQYKNEFKQFLYISLGSCSELETQLIITNRRNYISKEQFSNLEKSLDSESKMLMSLIKKVEKWS